MQKRMKREIRRGKVVVRDWTDTALSTLVYIVRKAEAG